MAEITVQDYAEKLKVSVQSVYKKIKRGILETVTRDGRKYIVVDDKELEKIEKAAMDTQTIEQSGWTEWLNHLTRELDRLQEENNRLAKENRRLAKKLEKCAKQKEKVLLSYIQELKHFQLMHKADEEIIETEVRPKKKKKKHK